MPELKAMKQLGEKVVTYDLEDGDVVHVTVVVNRITGEDLDRLNTTEDQEQVRAMFELLCRAIIDWDITDEGEKLPISEDSLNRLPAKFASSIMEKITEQLNPQRRSGGSFARR